MYVSLESFNVRVFKKRSKNETPRGVSFLPRFLNIKRHDPGKKRHEPKTIQSIISDIANATKNDTIGKSRTFEIITSGVTTALVSSLVRLPDLPAVDVLAVEVGHVAGVELVVRLRLLLAHHAGRRRKGLPCVSK